jgi:hypothetical protein
MTPFPDEKYFSSQFLGWPPINPNKRLRVRSVFDSLFVRRVTLSAQRLKRARPEPFKITPMRLNVVAHTRRCDPPPSQTKLAKRLFLQLLLANRLPSVVLVQVGVSAHL